MENAELAVKKQKDKTERKISGGFSIIGVGASAGGLEALKGFFENFPDDFEHSFVVVQHLSPDHKSLMAELLTKNTKLPILEVSKKTVVKPAHIYLIPPKKNIYIKDGSLYLKDKPLNQLNLPIDIFFRSLSKERKEDAIVVILSGTGSDGSSGAREVKENGGLVVVQNPVQAKFNSMPQNAINTRLVDYVLPVEQMGEELHRFIHQPVLLGSVEDKIVRNESTLLQILNFVNTVTALDFESYKRPTLVRMIARRMGVKNINTLDNYKAFLIENPSEADILVREFLVGVTNFFRDKAVWDILESDIVPKLIASKTPRDMIKCWCVGVSSGEEAYSLAILINEALQKNKLNNQVKIFGTDIEINHLEDGNRGLYKESAVSGLSAKRLKENFTKKGDAYQINPNIRKMVIFSQHNVLKDPPFIKMDITTCRNLLIYMQPSAQSRAIDVLHYSLNLHGHMILGSSESISSHKHVFEEIHRKEKIFRNKRISKTVGTSSFISNGSLQNTFGAKAMNSEKRVNEKIAEAINENLEITTIIIDVNFNIVNAIGNLANYISLPNRGFSMNLLKMIPDDFGTIIRHLVRKAQKSNKTERHLSTQLDLQEEIVFIDLFVSEFLEYNTPETNNFMIIFKPVEKPKVAKKIKKTKLGKIDALLFSELQSELEDTRQSLRNMIEEVETSNEELQTTNEELLASNEELQSTNEELQSVNEELHTVNSELQHKIEDLNQLHADLDNLFKNADIDILFLDKTLSIRKFTPNITKHFKIRESDIGRPLEDFSSSFTNHNAINLINDVKEVISKKVTKEDEIQDSNNNWYIQKLVPFFDSNNDVQGAIINYIDIQKVKLVQMKIEEKEAELRSMFDNSPDMFVSLDHEGKVTKCNNEVLSILGYDNHEELIGRHVTELHKTVDPEVFKNDFKKVGAGKVLRDLPYSLISKAGEEIPVMVNAKAIFNKDNTIKSILGSWRDIRKVVHMENQIKDKNMAFEQVLESTMAGFWDWNIKENTEYLSPSFKKMFGYEDNEMENKPEAWQTIIHPDDLGKVVKCFDKHVESKGVVPFDNEVRYFHKNGDIIWVWRKGKVIEWGENDEPIRMVGSHVNITGLKNLYQSNKELERFAYIASHDLQEPLRTIEDFITLFKSEYSKTMDDEAKTYLDFIEEASSRMGSLIKDILSYSKIGTTKDLVTVDLNELVDNVQQDLYLKIKNSGAKIKRKKLPKVEGFNIELHSLFLNLISNSIKFTKEGEVPNIEIGAVKGLKEGAHLYIKDNGIGIDKKDFDNIFEVFKRLHNQEEFEGTGIGLAHCKKIVDLHKGKIWVEAEPDQGSTFHITLNH